MYDCSSYYNDTCSSVYSNEFMDSVGFAWQESEAKARKYKIHKKAQSGRSMVEMLGVLAVIGVLSVAGIAGFKTAMDKHKANELLYEASKRATMVAAQIAQGRPGDVLSLSEFPETVGDSTFSVTKTALTGKFAITMTNVDKAICQNLMNTVGDKTQVRYMAMKDTPQTKITNCNDNPANYALVFNDDLTTVDAIFDDNTPTDPTTDNSYNSCGSNSGEVCSSTDCKIDWNRYNSLCGGSSTPSSSGGSPDDVYSGCGSNSGEVCTPSGTCKTDWTIWYSMCDSSSSTPSSSGGSPDDVYSACGSNSGEVCTPSGTCKTDWTIWYSMCDSAASSS